MLVPRFTISEVLERHPTQTVHAVGFANGPSIARSFRAGIQSRANVSNAMKIRVIVRWSVVSPEDVRHAMWKIFKQVPCRVAGHRSTIEVKTGKLALKCARCGWESPGWNIDPRFRQIDRASQHG